MPGKNLRNACCRSLKSSFAIWNLKVKIIVGPRVDKSNVIDKAWWRLGAQIWYHFNKKQIPYNWIGCLMEKKQNSRWKWSSNINPKLR